MSIRNPRPTELSAEDIHAMALGRVVCAWNNFHECLSHLFSALLDGHLSEPALAAWNSHRSDHAQRKMLEDTARVALATRPDLLKEIEWLLNRANSIANNRNDAIHATYALLYRNEGDIMIAHDRYGNRRSIAMAGKEDLVGEFDTYRGKIEALTVFCNGLFQSAVDPEGAGLPVRPHL